MRMICNLNKITHAPRQVAYVALWGTIVPTSGVIRFKVTPNTQVREGAP